MPFNLTVADIGEIPAVCPVLGIPLSPGEGKQTGASPSLDKVIPHLGYVPGNVVIISNRANTLKNNATPWELLAVYSYAVDQTFRAP